MNIHIRFRVLLANPLRRRSLPVRVRVQHDLALLGERARYPLQLEREEVEVDGAGGEADVVLAVVAAGAGVGGASVGPMNM